VSEVSDANCSELALQSRIGSLFGFVFSEIETNGHTSTLNTSHIEHPLISTLAGGMLSPSPVTSLQNTPPTETVTAASLSVFSNLNIATFATNPASLTTNTNWVSQLGSIGEIGFQMDLIKSILDALLKQPKNIDAFNINLSVNAQEIMPYISFQGQSTVSLDSQLRPFLSNLNIRLTAEFLKNIGIDANTKLDPKTLDFLKENLKITIGLGGSTSFSGETIFERGQGLTSQVFGIESAVGDIRITGQAIFTPTSQEFRVGASVCNLAFTGASLITATGQIQQSFGFELKFGSLAPSTGTSTGCQ